MAATLQICDDATGSILIDLSSYLRLGVDSELDPYSPSFEEPQFVAALGEGQPLASVDVKNREMVFPIYLNGTASKQALHTLVQTIVRALRSNIFAVWRDDAAVTSTAFDVQYARFEPAFKYMTARKLWLAGTVRLYVDPYGRQVSKRSIATAFFGGSITGVATHELFASIALASQGGDVPGLFTIKAEATAAMIPWTRPLWLFSAVTPAGHRLFHAASEIGAAAGVNITSTQLNASDVWYGKVARLLGTGTAGQYGQWSIRAGFGAFGTYVGRSRAMAFVRNLATQSLYVNGDCDAAPFSGATVSLPGASGKNNWSLVDLGVVDIGASSVSGELVSMFMAIPSPIGSVPIADVAFAITPLEDRPWTLVRDQMVSASDSQYEVIQVNATAFTTAGMSWEMNGASDTVSHVRGINVGNASGALSFARGSIDAYRAGAIPQLGTVNEVLVVSAFSGGASMTNPPRGQFLVTAQVTDRFFFAI